MHSINYCPGTLKAGHDRYCRTALKRVFAGRNVSHVLPYNSMFENNLLQSQFEENIRRISISGMQQKYSLIQVKNKLRLAEQGEQGTHILKPIPRKGRRADQMPANEHLTMQIARQVFGMSTAENALIFFGDGQPAYITRRFDVKPDASKWAQEDFAALAERTAATHGEHYKYLGNYLELFELMRKYVPAYRVEAERLFVLILFNYLFANGDAHLKNFSLIETKLGDFRLSPAYDLLNSRIHIDDQTFAMLDGLLPKNLAKGKIRAQFYILGARSGIEEKRIDKLFTQIHSKQDRVKSLIAASFLDNKTKRHYLQTHQARVKRLLS